MVDLMAGIAAASQGLAVVKQLREIGKEFQDADLKLKIVSLAESFSDAKIALLEAQEALHERDKQLEELKKGLAFRSEHTVRQEGRLYEVEAEGVTAELPFCPACDAKEATLIRVVTDQNFTMATCPACRAQYSKRSIRFRTDQPSY